MKVTTILSGFAIMALVICAGCTSDKPVVQTTTKWFGSSEDAANPINATIVLNTAMFGGSDNTGYVETKNTKSGELNRYDFQYTYKEDGRFEITMKNGEVHNIYFIGGGKIKSDLTGDLILSRVTKV